ncbi:protein FAM98A-like [Macrobrachium nipponense]|uniref:protein FAM98A-like n=1 Tax=Macrobrachium nipponense TaxID=159736 RepID=UPI0030C8B492
MENDILDSLEDLGYAGDISDETSLKAAVEGSGGGPRNMAYTSLVAWATAELKVLDQLEEMVNTPTSPEDHSSFLMELSSFLKELGCPHTQLTEGNVNQRLETVEQRLLLLDFLLAELMAARMISAAKPDQGMTVEMRESDHARELKNMLIVLGFPKPPANITPQQLFAKVDQKVNDVKSKAHPSLIGKPLFNGVLSDKQWALLDQMQQELHKEYTMRREMMIKRLDVTIQSFQWSDKAKQRENDLAKAFRTKRDPMKEEPDVSLGDMLAAREDLAVLEKTSNASVRKRTKTPLNKVVIGRVPDRGGRANELEPPPPEMPSWTQRSDGGGRGGGGGGGGGGGYEHQGGRGGGHEHQGGRGGGHEYQGHGGGRGGFSSGHVQGGWNQGGGRGGGGYDNRGGGGYDNRGGGGHDNRGGGYDNRNYNRGGGGYDNRGYDNRGYDNRSGHGGGGWGGGRGRGGRGGGHRY